MRSDSTTTKRDGTHDEIERLLDEREYSAVTGRSVASARRDRLLGRGCPYVKLGFLVRYRPSDVRAYIAQNVHGTQANVPKSHGADRQ